MTYVSWVPESCTVNSVEYTILGLSDRVDEKNRIFYIQNTNQSIQEQRLLHVWEADEKDELEHRNLERLKELSQEQPADSNSQRSLQQIFDFGPVKFPSSNILLGEQNETKRYFGVVLESLNGFPLSIYQDIYGVLTKEGSKEKQTKQLSFLQGLRIFYAVGTALLELMQKDIIHQNISPRSIWMLVDEDSQQASAIRTVMKPMLIDSYSHKAFDTKEYYQIWAPERHHMVQASKEETTTDIQKRLVFELSTLVFCLWKEDGILWGEGRSDQLREQKRRTPSLPQILNAAMIVRDSDVFDPSDLGLHTEAIREVWESEDSRKQVQQDLVQIFQPALSFNPTERIQKFGIEVYPNGQSSEYTLGTLLSSVRFATLNIALENQLSFYVKQVLFPLVNEKPEAIKKGGLVQKGFENLKRVELVLRQIALAVSHTQMSCFNPYHMYRLSNTSDWTTDSIVSLQKTNSKYIGHTSLDQQRSRLKYSLFVFFIEVLGGAWLPEDEQIDTTRLRKHFTRHEAIVTYTILRLKNEKTAKIGFDKLHQILESSIENQGSFTSFYNDLMTQIGDLIEESKQQLKIDIEKKKLEAQRKIDQERKEAETKDLEDEASPVEESDLAEPEVIRTEDDSSTEVASEDIPVSNDQSSGSKGGLLAGILLLLLLIVGGGWFYLQQQVAFTKTTLDVDCDSDDPSCLACEEGDISCIESKSRKKLLRLQKAVLASPLNTKLSEDGVGICMMLLQTTEVEFSQLDEDVQTQCLGQVARVGNGLGKWWEWWESGYVNAMGLDMQAMENAIHIQCPSSGKTKCEKSYCEFVERLILDGNNAGECLKQPTFEACVDGGFNYSGIEDLASSKFEWCE
ncbi:MAG: hypothetical protein CL916_12790 [Deltaproteobacteria bacterium]|nr:hypothetical protein [Deltaproteobacteria bacterium]